MVWLRVTGQARWQRTQGCLLHTLTLVLADAVFAPVGAEASVELLIGLGTALQGGEGSRGVIKLQTALTELAVPESHRAGLVKPALLRTGDPTQLVRKRVVESKLKTAGVPGKPQLEASACAAKCVVGQGASRKDSRSQGA